MAIFDPSQIKQRLQVVCERIKHAAQRAGRQDASICLVAVSKKQPLAAIAAAYAAGQRDFGENYVSELAAKAAELPNDIRWHQVGPVQRRAAAHLPQQLYCLQTLDRIELLERLARVRSGTWPMFLLQVNIGREPQKSGVAPENAAALLAKIRERFAKAHVAGLMTIPPQTASAQAARPYFAALRELRDRLATQFGQPLLLSMGMSQDYAEAIAEGADIVRVGSAIFGERPNH